MCLHHRGWLYRSPSTRKKCLPGCYYVKGIDKWKQSRVLGLGDFLIYNILVLISIPPSTSLIIKICVAFGTLVSVQIGHLLTHRLQHLMKIALTPAVPLLVITASIYIFLVDIIFRQYFNPCIE
jgi:hypothetical protein